MCYDFLCNELKYFMASPVVSLTCAFGSELSNKNSKRFNAIHSLAQQTTDANEKPDSVWTLKNKG